MQFISENTLFAVKCLVYDVVQGNHLKNIEIILKMGLKFPIFPCACINLLLGATVSSHQIH